MGGEAQGDWVGLGCLVSLGVPVLPSSTVHSEIFLHFSLYNAIPRFFRRLKWCSTRREVIPGWRSHLLEGAASVGRQKQ